MRLQNIILLLSALLLSSVTSAQKVNIINPIIEKIGDNVFISFDAKIDKVSTNYMLTLTPVLWVGNKEQALPPIIVIGRNMSIIQARRGEVIEGNIIENSSITTSYKANIPFKKWMGGISFRIDKILEGCCTKEMLTPMAILKNKLEPTLPFITPLFESRLKSFFLDNFKEVIKDYPFVGYIRDETRPDGLDIYFELDRSVIKESFMENATSIQKIHKVIKLIKSSHNIELTKITITGGTSPEGSVLHNKRLGQNRSESVINYFSKEIDPSIFSVENIGENWDGLYSIVKSSEMKYRDEVLSIIDNYPIDKGRERQLKKLGNGKPYRYMLKEFFPKLRRASYVQVFYDIKLDDNDTKIEKASELIKASNYQAAIAMLLEAKQTPYTKNLIGVCYMMTKDVVNARIYFQRAIYDGSDEAQKNLNLLDYQKDNIQYK